MWHCLSKVGGMTTQDSNGLEGGSRSGKIAMAGGGVGVAR